MGRAFVLRLRSGGARGWVGVGLFGSVVVTAAASCNGGPPKTGSIEYDGGLLPYDGGGDDTSSSGVVSGSSSSASTSSSSGGPCVTCGTRCVDINLDSKNCGGCGQVCGTGASCQGATCVCPTGQAQCNGKCVNVATDPSNCGFCGHNCQGSTCTAGLCPTTAIGNADTGQIINGMAIDTTNTYWTWTNYHGATTAQTTGISLKPFAGGMRVDLTYADQIYMPGASGTVGVGDFTGIWIDQLNLYMTDIFNGAVLSTDRRSGFNSTIGYAYQPQEDAGPNVRSAAQPIAITADDVNVYWVDYAVGALYQARIDGSSGYNPQPLVTGLDHPIAVAATGGYVYWINYGTTQANTGSVNKVARATGAVVGAAVAPTPLATGENQPQGIATDGSYVYWTSTTNTGSVRKVSASGGAVTILAQNQGGPWALVVDQPSADAGTGQNYVYWTNFNDNNIQKVLATNTAPSAPYVLASQQNNPIAIAVDSKAVYWANQGDGTLWKVAK